VNQKSITCKVHQNKVHQNKANSHQNVHESKERHTLKSERVNVKDFERDFYARVLLFPFTLLEASSRRVREELCGKGTGRPPVSRLFCLD